MALAKTMKKKQKLKKPISTDAIRHSYLYRQIAMSRNIDTVESDRDNEQHSVDAIQLKRASVSEVLLWEAT